MNMPDVNKKHLGVLLPLDLLARLRAYARKNKLTMSEVAQIAIQRAVGKFPISAEDIEWVARETRKNEIKRNFKGE